MVVIVIVIIIIIITTTTTTTTNTTVIQFSLCGSSPYILVPSKGTGIYT